MIRWRRVLAIGMGGALVWAVGLILLNVWVTAELMFLSEHDLTLSAVLLGFSAAIAMGFGYIISVSVSGAIGELVRGANEPGRSGLLSS